MFALHGAQKLFGFPPSGKPSMPLNTFMTVGGILEFVLGLMVMLGLFAGFAAFIASGEMAVAYFMAHQPQGALPIQNGGELAALYAFVFLFIAARGSGVLSLDSLIFGKDVDTPYRT
jgi:putative oxidoreductase